MISPIAASTYMYNGVQLGMKELDISPRDSPTTENVHCELCIKSVWTIRIFPNAISHSVSCYKGASLIRIPISSLSVLHTEKQGRGRGGWGWYITAFA